MVIDLSRMDRILAVDDVSQTVTAQAAVKGGFLEAALATRGLDYIHPVPFADPRRVPPPRELGASKHFNDLTRIVIEYESFLRQG